MRTKTILLTGVISLLSVVAFAQSYSIDAHTIDGGGGRSTGPVFSVSGGIGQVDAGTSMSSDSFSLAGGFWSVTLVPNGDAPLLKVFLTATNTAIISWSAPAEFVLQQSGNLSLSNWVAAPQLPADNGTNRFIIVTPQPGHRFYRLFKP